MIKDLGLILQTYLVLLGVGLIASVWLFKMFPKLVDRGWVMGKVGGSLVLALIVWFLALLKIRINTNEGVALLTLLLTGATIGLAGKAIRPMLGQLKKKAWLILIEEILFLVGLAGYALVRGYQPDILGLEKFMDFGFIKSYLSSPTLPAPDMWWAGSQINYYSFGHFWSSMLIRIWGVSDGAGYNLMLAFVMGSSLALVFSIIVNMLSDEERVARPGIIAGLMGALLVILGGNSHTVWSFLSKRTLTGYWYADATRFIHNTIHEFPAYSFVVSDLHGHVLSLPIVLTFILLLVNRKKNTKKLVNDICLGVLLGVMAMTNTWDTPIYLMLVTIFFGLEILSGEEGSWFDRGVMASKSLAVILAVAILTGMPWMVSFKSISNGVGAVAERSPLWQLAGLWSVHLVITLMAMTVVIAKNSRTQKLKNSKPDFLVLALGLTAITLLLIPEFIFVRDIYPSHPRANTMFKLTYQAFIMMGILFGWLVGQIGQIKKTLVKVGFIGIVAVSFTSLMIFPGIAFETYYNNFKSYRGVNGLTFLSTRFREDLGIINYLNSNRDGRNMIEAVGDSYTDTDFISAFSGVPTVVGWRVHEWLWRGGYEPVGKREEEVRRFYETKSPTESSEMIEKYNLGWIVITAREREKYKIDDKIITALGEVVYAGKTSYLIRVK
jgi:uncharacterized membrane protein